MWTWKLSWAFCVDVEAAVHARSAEFVDDVEEACSLEVKLFPAARAFDAWQQEGEKEANDR